MAIESVPFILTVNASVFSWVNGELHCSLACRQSTSQPAAQYQLHRLKLSVCFLHLILQKSLHKSELAVTRAEWNYIKYVFCLPAWLQKVLSSLSLSVCIIITSDIVCNAVASRIQFGCIAKEKPKQPQFVCIYLVCFFLYLCSTVLFPKWWFEHLNVDFALKQAENRHNLNCYNFRWYSKGTCNSISNFDYLRFCVNSLVLYD